jgi:DNA-binding beta-propeller fold protein YncE
MGQGVGQFALPRGVAVDREGNLFVADTGNQRVQKLSATGAPLASLAMPRPPSSAPAGVAALAVDEAGSIYIADAAGHSVLKLSADGALLVRWGG